MIKRVQVLAGVRAFIAFIVIETAIVFAIEVSPISSGGDFILLFPTVSAGFLLATIISQFGKVAQVNRSEITLLVFWGMLLWSRIDHGNAQNPEQAAYSAKFFELALYTLPVPIFCSRFFGAVKS